MLQIIIGFLGGILASLLANLTWDWYKANQIRIYRLIRRFKPIVKLPAGSLILGGNIIPWLVCAYGPYSRENIKVFYNPHEKKKPPEIQTMYNEKIKDVKRKESKGESVPFNGLGYQLESFSVDYRTGEHEEPNLRLSFRPTDYFTMLVTDNRLDEPIIIQDNKTTLRKHFADRVDLAVSPVPEFATHFGVGIMVITKDDKIIFSERGKTAVDAYVFFPSVAEGSSRPIDDISPKGGPDPYRTAVRGIIEELGVEVHPDDIKFLSFGVNAVICEYALCGVVQVNYTENDIIRIRSLGTPKDRWENQKLHFVSFTPNDISDFIAKHRPWSPFAMVCVAHAVYDRFGKEKLEHAFTNMKVCLSEDIDS